MRIACGLSQGPSDLLPEYQAIAIRLYRTLHERITEDTLGYLFHTDPPG
jgi:hypothetical protein